jgi:phosphopantetheine--protein transferase-like protein
VSASVDLAPQLDALRSELETVRTGDGGIVGVGIDAVDLDRFRRVLARRPGLASRLLTPAERRYAAAVPDHVPRTATRFAAKEAVLKALGVGLGACAFAEIEAEREGLGAPRLVLAGRAVELAARRGVAGWHLSLTHTDTVALAVAVALPGPSPERSGGGPCGRS